MNEFAFPLFSLIVTVAMTASMLLIRFGVAGALDAGSYAVSYQVSQVLP